jgi:hypothetical protein
MTSVEPARRAYYCLEELVELRRNTLRYARAFPLGNERNQHRQVAVSLRKLFRGQNWLRTHTLEGAMLLIDLVGTKPDPSD